MADGFLGRWSRRKIDVSEGKPLDEPLPEPPVAKMDSPAAKPLIPVAPAAAAAAAEVPQQETQTPEPALPSMEDVGRLTTQSDFKPFVARGVSPEVKNAAMKKLFSDPHYNVMDGLDIYIGDYSLPDPLPVSMIRQMASAEFLDLFDEKKNAQAKAARDSADSRGPQSVAESQATPDGPHGPTDNNPAPSEDSQTSKSDAMTQMSQPTDTADHANTDLRLQQDHAAGAEDPRRHTE